MNSKLFMIGLSLIFLGIAIIIFSSLISIITTKEVTIGGGALIMIGPIPILVSAGIPPLILIFLIIIMLIIMVFQIYIFFKYRKKI
ncbi:MAG: hypothetical protein QXF09_05985 [Nitrososphaerota archaeon]